jgi:hypothetical protein
VADPKACWFKLLLCRPSAAGLGLDDSCCVEGANLLLLGKASELSGWSDKDCVKRNESAVNSKRRISAPNSFVIQQNIIVGNDLDFIHAVL